MNLLGKITKTQFLLVFITISFIGSLSVLHARASDTAAGTDYTITVAYREPEPVTPRAPALIDLNTATLEELQTLGGIGAVMAQRIIDYRTECGPFACVEDILKVKGIGEATLEKFRSHVTVSQQASVEQIVPERESETEDSAGEAIEEPPEEPDDLIEDTEPEEPEQAPGGEPELPEKIDINTATLEELRTLSGIGEVLAQRIVDYRTEHGPFACVEDILKVKGIGEATLEKLRSYVTVSAQSAAEDSTAEAQEVVPPADEPQESALIDINTAALEELQTLSGIGAVLAQRIIDYRTEHGPFTCVEELLSVNGIGEATLEKFREQVTVLPPTASEPADETTTAEEDPE